MKLYIISSGKYGSRIVNSLAEMGLASSMVGLEEIPEDLPEFIDDFEEYVPKSIPSADLILAVGLYGDINMIVLFEIINERCKISDHTPPRPSTGTTRTATGDRRICP
jgi:hypothetical protein